MLSWLGSTLPLGSASGKVHEAKDAIGFYVKTELIHSLDEY